MSDLPSFADEIRRIVQGPPAVRKEDPNFYKPRYQACHSWNGTQWIQVKDSVPLLKVPQKLVRVITWNIDMLIPFAVPRMAAALDYLSTLVGGSEVPIIVMLQEMVATDLRQIQETAWVRNGFIITDIDSKSWSHPSYGTTMLVDRRLGLKSCFRIPLVSKFSRDALFVDIATSSQEDKVSRFSNLHLESLALSPPLRPDQLSDVSVYLQAKEVVAGVAAGDMNAIEPFDRVSHTKYQLKDAYLELGGEEDHESGFTWGTQVKQALRDQFGCSRMDKVLYCGALHAKVLQRIGVGVCVEADGIKQDMEKALEGSWVSDHFGLDCELELRGDVEFAWSAGESREKI